jgi:MFS family permease
VVGASNVIILSMGGDTSITALPLGAFFLGASLISCGITEPLFRRFGRKIGLWTGCGVGLLATALCAVSLLVKSPALNIIGTFFFGAANGIGFFLRFAAVELVPPAWKARAVTLVVSGGVIGAFAGPESGQFTRGMFGSNSAELYYMGVYVMTTIFNVASILFIGFVRFTPVAATVGTAKPSTSDNGKTKVASSSRIKSFVAMYRTLLTTRSFLVTTLIATLFWAIMAVPMSILRIAMKDAGYTSRQSLSAIELHFVGMYAPGFVTGSLIDRFGIRAICWTGLVVSCAGVVLNLLSETRDDGTLATWVLGMIAVGTGWNFCFTGATVGLTKTLNDVPFSKGEVQSANECLSFLIAGACVFVSSYIYDTAFWGSGILSGWQTLNYCVVGLLVVAGLTFAIDYYMETTSSRGHEQSLIAMDKDVEAPKVNESLSPAS